MKRTFEPIPKPVRVRDPDAIERARLDYCELCDGPYAPEQIHVHHVKSRGAGGGDVDAGPDANLVSLCWLCHQRVHEGRIPRAALRALITARESLRVRLGGLSCPACGRSRWRWSNGTMACRHCEWQFAPQSAR